jgi:hypothetical protein
MRSKPGLSAAIRKGRRAALVVNARSRRGRRLFPAVRARLLASGFDVLGSFPAGRAGGLGASLAAAVDLRPDLLIVGGGDGTVSEAARCLAYRDMALGVLPLGTTNNFARTLGIPPRRARGDWRAGGRQGRRRGPRHGQRRHIREPRQRRPLGPRRRHRPAPAQARGRRLHPARITLAPQALRVMVAPGFHDT